MTRSREQLSLFGTDTADTRGRAAHNSTWKTGITYRGRKYAGPHDLHAASPQPSRVNVTTFAVRLNRRRAQGNSITDALIDECLTTSVKDYQVKYGARRTYLVINSVRKDAAKIYASLPDPMNSYEVFRGRLVRLMDRTNLNDIHIQQAATLNQSEWISFHGGGRRREILYEGDTYPEHDGRIFPGISAFLRIIGRYEDKGTIWARIKAGWTLDDAVSNPVLPADERLGKIYVITQLSTGMRYVGLTINPLTTRLNQHIRSSLNSHSPRPLSTAMRTAAPSDFVINLLEGGLLQDDLPSREKHHIAEQGTLWPHGLNANKGGAIGVTKSTSYEHQGEPFRSKSHAVAILSERTGHAPHVVSRWLDRGKPLTDKARRRHDHPDAGSNLHRRWKGMIRNARNGVGPGEVDPRWTGDDGYDRFKADVVPKMKEGLELIRPDRTKPYGPDNFAWGTRRQNVSLSTGIPITVHGTEYPSLKHASQAFGIGHSTLKYRISKGMTPEEAVTTPIGPTSNKSRTETIVVDGIEFPSTNAAAHYASSQHGITFDQAKYRLACNLPMNHERKRMMPIEIDGITFESITAAARHYEIPQTRFAGRRGKGWTMREALELDPRPKRT